jgi:hypothetical protein
MQIEEVWAAPATPDTPPNALRLCRTTFGKVAGTAEAAQTPKLGILQSSKNPCVLPGRVYYDCTYLDSEQENNI